MTHPAMQRSGLPGRGGFSMGGPNLGRTRDQGGNGGSAGSVTMAHAADDDELPLFYASQPGGPWPISRVWPINWELLSTTPGAGFRLTVSGTMNQAGPAQTVTLRAEAMGDWNVQLAEHQLDGWAFSDGMSYWFSCEMTVIAKGKPGAMNVDATAHTMLYEMGMPPGVARFSQSGSGISWITDWAHPQIQATAWLGEGDGGTPIVQGERSLFTEFSPPVPPPPSAGEP